MWTCYAVTKATVVDVERVESLLVLAPCAVTCTFYIDRLAVATILGGGGEGAIVPSIKKYQGESVFSPLNVLAFLYSNLYKVFL